VQAGAEAFVIDAAVHIALLFLCDGALEPGASGVELADFQQSTADRLSVINRNHQPNVAISSTREL
jgi:hypothetical protein